MPIKDKDYWKEYNRKRKEKGYFQLVYQNKKEVKNHFQQNYLKSKVVKNGEEVVNSEVVKSEAVVKFPQVVKVVKTQENILQPKEIVKSLQPSPVVKNESLQPIILQPCSRCLELETKIKNLEKPINPTIELWKGRYFDLEKETNRKLTEQSETISRLKEKLRNLSTKNQEWEQKYSRLENSNKNTNNYLSMPNLYALISKHKYFQTIQHKYTDRDVKERELLKSLLDKLWIFN